MSDEIIKIIEEDLSPKEQVIKITEEDLQQNEITVVIDGEETKVATSVVVGWNDILKAEASNPSRVDFKIPLSERDNTEYDHEVVSNLKGDVQRMKKDGMDPRGIYRGLALRYHPDLYQDEEVKQLAQEYTSALTGLKNAGELE